MFDSDSENVDNQPILPPHNEENSNPTPIEQHLVVTSVDTQCVEQGSRLPLP